MGVVSDDQTTAFAKPQTVPPVAGFLRSGHERYAWATAEIQHDIRRLRLNPIVSLFLSY